MAEVTVKLFGVFRSDTHLAEEKINIKRVIDIFPTLNKRVDEVYEENRRAQPGLEHPDPLSFKDAVIYINGERCLYRTRRLADGDEVWLMSPASGG